MLFPPRSCSCQGRYERSGSGKGGAGRGWGRGVRLGASPRLDRRVDETRRFSWGRRRRQGGSRRDFSKLPCSPVSGSSAGKGSPPPQAPPPPRCPTALPWECVTAIFRQDPVPPAVKLLPGALAFIFHRFLENVFFPLSLAVRSWPSPWIFEGRFLTPPFFRVLFQPVFISPVSDLKSKQKNPLKP